MSSKPRVKAGLIYALSDPDTLAIRYIGQTRNWEKRYAEHCRLSNNLSGTHRAKWLTKFLKDGKRPVGLILERTDELDAAEIRWVSHYCAMGCDLVNGNKGGQDLSHARKALQGSEWRGHTPLQSAQMEMASAIRTLKRLGHHNRAERIEQKLATVKEKIAFVRRTSGKEGVARMNRCLAASMA